MGARCLVRFLCVCLFVIILGCGDASFMMPDAVPLTGTLTDSGEPLFVEGLENATGMIVLGFHAIIDGKPGPEVTTATVDLEGKFEIPQGIEAGEYLITVRQWEPYPQKDLLKGKFSAAKSKIRRTIDGTAPLDIDIANPDG